MVKVIKEQPNYAVSETGRVFSIKPNGLVELKKDISNGYPRVNLNGKKYYVANLVANAFIPQQDVNLKIFYIDGDKENCNVENLIWLNNSDIQFFSHYTVEYRRYLAEQMRGRA